MDLSSRLTGQMTELLVTTNMSYQSRWFSACEPSSKQGYFPWIHPLPRAAQGTPSLKFQAMGWDGPSGNVFWFLFTLRDWSPPPQHVRSAPWREICIFLSRWFKISDMFLSWILPWQLERAVTSGAKYGFSLKLLLYFFFFSFNFSAFSVSFPLQYRNSWK